MRLNEWESLSVVFVVVVPLLKTTEELAGSFVLNVILTVDVVEVSLREEIVGAVVSLIVK